MSHPYSKGARVWIPDEAEAWIGATVTSLDPSSSTSIENDCEADTPVTLHLTSERGDTLSLTFPYAILVQSGKVEGVLPPSPTGSTSDVQGSQVGKDAAGRLVGLPPLRNPPSLEGKVDDLAELSVLNEPSVLHAIRTRYKSYEWPYIYSGIVLVALNPFQALRIYESDMIQTYATRKKSETDPHIFAIAQEVLDSMRRGDGNGGKDQTGAGDQTIVVSGESGAGKTVSAKFILRYFASVKDNSKLGRGQALPIGDSGMSETEKQILASNPIMEAFGNAKTTRNDNSSRFGKYLEVMFDLNHNIVGARMRTYLLERSRLVYQAEIERNYHIFYQLLAGAPAKEKKDLGLDVAPSHFAYLAGGGPASTPINGVDDAVDFSTTQRALSTIGVSVERQWQIFRLLAGLLHLGNVKITAARNDSNIASDDPSLLLATELLGVDNVEFRKWTTKKQLVTRQDKIVTNLNAAAATVVRDSVAKSVYSCLFDWLVSVVNESLGGEGGKGMETARKFIGVLDIYGFEHFKKNSFEQFCINWANEKLQQEFNAHVFKLEQEEYVSEEINWTFIEFADNQRCIDVIEGKMGILTLLDEESRLPAGTDMSFAAKIHATIVKPEQKSVFKKPRFNQNAFTICHYANDVTYDVDGFLDKNRDTVPDEHLALLQGTSNGLLKDCLDAALTAATNAASSGPPPKGATANGIVTRKAGAANQKKPTLGTIFKVSLVSLMETINNTNVHYIRCIKPNEAKAAWTFDEQQVLGQLRACGVLETIRISCAGYPSRWTFEEFAERYYQLVHSKYWSDANTVDIRVLCRTVLDQSLGDPDKYQFGLTKIFFRAGQLAVLEGKRTERLNVMVTIIQKNVRRRIAMNHYKKLRAAVILVQSRCRGLLARRAAELARRERAALIVQTFLRAWTGRRNFLALRAAVIKAQSMMRGRQARARYSIERERVAATRLQSLLRGAVARRGYRNEVKQVIYLQSCYRRRLARKELAGLRVEAKSATKYKEISYKLENKVVELTQNLQARTQERKALREQVNQMEQQLTAWEARHQDAEAKIRDLHASLQKPSVPVEQFQALIAAKASVEAKLEEALAHATQQDRTLDAMKSDLSAQAQELEEKQRAVEGAVARSNEDSTAVGTLRGELAALKEQMNRANALQALTRGSRAPQEVPSSPTRPNHANGGARGFEEGSDLLQSAKRRRQRTHSINGAINEHSPTRNSTDEVMLNGRRDGQQPRAVSMAVLQTNGINGLTAFDDPEDEIMMLLDDVEPLESDVIGGLIKDLRLPAPSTNHPPKYAEVMFPGQLISLITNEMWRFGLVPQSERFLAGVMQNIQQHVMSFEGEESIGPGIFWLSNVHEVLSYVTVAEADMMQGYGPGAEGRGRQFDWQNYERLVTIVKHDLDSLEYNIYHTFMQEVKRTLSKMIIPALIESQALPGFVTAEAGTRLFNRILGTQPAAAPAHNMEEILALLDKVWKTLTSYHVDESVIAQAINEMLKLIGVTSFNDMLMRRNFCSWKRAMQIQYNITRIEEWCKTHNMQEGPLQLESLMQATKLLQLKKATPQDIDILFDVCWILSPTQIQKLLSQYHVADYEAPISPDVLKMVAARLLTTDKGDTLLLQPETEEAGPYVLPPVREIPELNNYVPAFLSVPSLRRLALLVST